MAKNNDRVDDLFEQASSIGSKAGDLVASLYDEWVALGEKIKRVHQLYHTATGQVHPKLGHGWLPEGEKKQKRSAGGAGRGRGRKRTRLPSVDADWLAAALKSGAKTVKQLQEAATADGKSGLTIPKLLKSDKQFHSEVGKSEGRGKAPQVWSLKK